MSRKVQVISRSHRGKRAQVVIKFKDDKLVQRSATHHVAVHTVDGVEKFTTSTGGVLVEGEQS